MKLETGEIDEDTLCVRPEGAATSQPRGTTRAWARAEEELVDRTESPGDDPTRRPSHTDKWWTWRRELLAQEIRAVVRAGITEVEIQAVAERLLNLAA
jgi:hypothetical protein